MTSPQREPTEECILLVDDDPAMLRSLSHALSSEGFSNMVPCPDPRDVEVLSAGRNVAVVLLDLMMPHLSGETMLDWFATRMPETPVVMVTAVDDVDSAVRCIKAGAFDYLVKPVDFPRLIAVVARALQAHRLRVENQELKRRITVPEPENPELFKDIITCSPAMKGIFRYVESIAASGEPVLIIGETGTGKELVAAAVHRASGCEGELVPVNIAGVDQSAFADTLFGHVRGAFTGADRNRGGLIERAAGGTLFLDEIGDLDPEMQTKLLRLIQDKEYFPLGADKPSRSRARVLAVTNRDLHRRIRDGRFREDLFFRLHAHQIRVPALRERPEDIPPLVSHFLREAAATLGKETPTTPKELFAYLATYPFPGNVRELRSMVIDAVACHDKGVLSLASFLRHMDQNTSGGAQRKPGETLSENRVSFGADIPSLKEATIRLFREALRRAEGNQSIAARMLGVSRRTINRYVTAGLLEDTENEAVEEITESDP